MDLALRAALKRGFWRAAAVACLLGAVAATAGDVLLQRLLPLVKVLVEAAEPAFAVQGATVAPTAAGSRLRVQVALAHTLVVGGRAVVPHPQGTAFALVPAALAWQMPLVLLAAAAAWPARSWPEWAWRMTLALPLAALLMAVDLPLAVAAEFWRLLMAAHDPNGWQPHVAWADFLRSGGRVGLALCGAAAATALAPRLAGSHRMV